MDMQLRKSNDFRRPAPIFADGFGRTGRTHRFPRNQNQGQNALLKRFSGPAVNLKKASRDALH